MVCVGQPQCTSSLCQLPLFRLSCSRVHYLLFVYFYEYHPERVDALHVSLWAFGILVGLFPCSIHFLCLFFLRTGEKKSIP